jgi:hypothetical protein
MPSDLREFADLLARDPDADGMRAAIGTAIQALLVHQIVYEDTYGVGSTALQALKTHHGFLSQWFAVAGLRLVREPREQMFYIEAAGQLYGWNQNRLRKDETLVRLALRMILDEGLRKGAADALGRVASDTDEIIDTFRTLGSREPPAQVRLDEILRDLARRGGVRIGDHDRSECLTTVVVLPGMRAHVPEAFASQVQSWAAKASEAADVACSGGQDTEVGGQAAPPVEVAASTEVGPQAGADTDEENSHV